MRQPIHQQLPILLARGPARFNVVATWMTFAALICACEKTIEPTEVLVSVDSDLSAGDQLARLDVEVFAGNGTGLPLREATFPLVAERGKKAFSLPLSFSIVPSAGDTRDFRVVVTGVGSLAGSTVAPVVEKQVIAAFQPNTQIRLDIFLSQLCFGKLCRDGEGRRGDLTCNAAGECDAVPNDTPGVAPSDDAAAETFTDASSEDSQVALSDTGVLADTAVPNPGPLTEAGADAMQSPDDASGPASPAPECDVSHACTAGYTCVQEKCVSKCTQAPCDPNATCSLAAGMPVCSCNSGFIQSGSGAVTCTRDVSCEQLACDANATCVLNTDQTRSCVCKPGYTGNGKSCAPVDCGPAALLNGAATATNDITTYGGTVTYTCNTGYTRSGASTAMCGVDAKWSAAATCTSVDCGTPGLTNGKATLASGTAYGNTVTYTCNAGYDRSGSSMGTCGANRMWSPTATCVPVTCSGLATPARGSISTTDGNNFGSTATYSCSSATLQGNQSRMCQSNRQWSGTDPTCLYCGDGQVTSSEESCDPSAQPAWSVWSCTAQCTKRTNYIPCSGNTGSGSSMQGIGCDSGQLCFQGVCASYFCAGDTGCPGVPTGPTVARCSSSSFCIATLCGSASDCAPGLTCYTSANPPYCVGCSDTIACPAGKTCNKYINQAYGRCD